LDRQRAWKTLRLPQTNDIAEHRSAAQHDSSRQGFDSFSLKVQKNAVNFTGNGILIKAFTEIAREFITQL
jgi:hypothetical protein